MDGTQQALTQALRSTYVSTFGIAFENELHRRLNPTATVGLTKTLGALLVEIVEDVMQNAGYAHVLEAYRQKDPLTSKYSPLCRQALDLFIAQL